MQTSMPLAADTPADAAQQISGISRWHFPLQGWGVLGFALIVAFIPFYNVLGGLFAVWNDQPEYSHGVLIPLISLFLVWRERDALSRTVFAGSWAGLAVVLAGLLLWYLAELSTIYVIGQYAFLVELYGLVIALGGFALFRRLAIPMLILILMIPLPAFFANPLSLKLQLLSSALGVDVIRLAGISVYLEGNVIDLGTFKLQVVEACNGLRYLFPLMTVAFLVAYFFKAALWKRTLVVVASIPIAVLMNSLRIGLIGVTVEYWGREAAEGLLHDFEGWVVFMISGIGLLALAAVLARIGNPRVRLRDVLTIDWGPSPPKSVSSQPRKLSVSFLAATALTTVIAVFSLMVPERVEVPPPRTTFAEFPTGLGGWDLRRTPLEVEYRDALKLDDYLLAEFRRPSGLPVSVWIAYYDSQRKGQSVHSPKSCLPGGGWEFSSLRRHELRTPSGAMTLNRAVIEHGDERALMYYWFQQRGRVIADEYLVKWFIFQDALIRNRTDGALIRLMVPLPRGTNEAEADRQLTQFTTLLTGRLGRYVPD